MNGFLQFTRRQLHCLHAKIRSNSFDCVRFPLSRGPITGLEQFGDLPGASDCCAENWRSSFK